MKKKYIIFILILFIISGCGKKKEQEENVTITLQTEKREYKEKPSTPSVTAETKKKETSKEAVSQPTSYETKEETKKVTETKIKERPASEIFASAQKLYQEGKFSQALEEFQNYTLKYPGESNVPESMYMIGLIYLENLKLYPRAQSVFKSLIKEHPQYSKNDNAQFLFAKAVYLENRFEEATIEYRKVLENYPHSKIADKALFAIGNIYLGKLFNEDEAVKIFDDFLQQFPDSDLKYQVIKTRQDILDKRDRLKKEVTESLKREQEKKKLEEEHKRREEERRKQAEKKRIEEEMRNEESKRYKEDEERKREEEKERKIRVEKEAQEAKKRELERNKDAILSVIQNHKAAMEARDIKLYVKNWYSIPGKELEDAEKIFKRFKRINISFSNIEISLDDSNATANINQDMVLIDDVDNKELKASMKMKWGFVKDNDTWKISKTEVLK